jgi:hypothetical protein
MDESVGLRIRNLLGEFDRLSSYESATAWDEGATELIATIERTVQDVEEKLRRAADAMEEDDRERAALSIFKRMLRAYPRIRF